MADHSKPTTTSLYTDFVNEITGRFADISKWFDPAVTTPTNVPTNAIRWSSAVGYWEKFNGSVWAALASTYNISVSHLGGSAAALYALLASPTFTGTPAAPTAAADTTTTQLATTGFVIGQAGTNNPVMDGTATVGTSKKYSREDHIHPTDTTRAPLASPTFTGTPAAPTPTAGDSTTKLATTAFVTAAIAAAPIFPVGTAMLFAQTSAPTGWTKSTTHDNKALRVVSGTAGSGGSVAFTTAFASQGVSGTVGATTLSIAQIPSHSHSYTSPSASANQGGKLGNTAVSTGGTTGAQGGGGSHDHSFSGTAINLAVQYVDVIIATKN